MFEKKVTKNAILVISCACLMFFSFLVYISYNQIIIKNIFFGIFVEFFTIPFIILLLVLLWISIREFHSRKWSIKSTYFFSMIILLITVSLIVIATLLNI